MVEKLAVAKFRRSTNQAAGERPEQHRREEHQNGRNRELRRIRETNAAALSDCCRHGQH